MASCPVILPNGQLNHQPGDLAMVRMSFLGTVVCMSSLVASWAPAAEPALPATWQAAWQQPVLGDRPLQIIHKIDPKRSSPTGMKYYQDLGLGGAVTNVGFDQYLVSEENWQKLVAGVEAFANAGMSVWLYDEKGYPSGSAGGLVLKDHPEYEAQELAYDASQSDPFIVRPSYEYTHASNNYHCARRYLNLIDDRAVQAFIAVTHDAYAKRLEKHFGHAIVATFTDEPSLLAMSMGQIPEKARQKVPVHDPVNPQAAMRPAVPWAYDLADRYRQRYAEDLLGQRRSLFVGDAPEDRKVRRQFWALIADLVAERYFGALQSWCHRHGVASSGHTLAEESLMHHVPLEGNALKCLARMDIPGLDELNSNPEVVIYNGWLTAGLPMSAALLTGNRRVMTEISDFSQKMSDAGPAALGEMQATAAWQATWGVTEFTLYYSPADRSAEAYRAYGDYVGRLNTILKPAQPVPEVALYYPVADLWPEYRPVAAPLRLDSQSPRAQRIVQSFNQLGQGLQRNQMPFVLIDHEFLAQATVRTDGKLAIQRQAFKALVLPEDVELPPAAAAVVEQFRKAGGRIVTDQRPARQNYRTLLEAIQPAHRLSPTSERIALGQFVRDSRRILLVVNVAKEPYQGQLTADVAKPWHQLDPATGEARAAEVEAGKLRLSLAPRQAVLLVEGK
jgi:hypothetical protein